MCVQVHPGDRVSVEFNAAAGTLAFLVNGASQGVCVSGLAGKELFPTVAFYNTGSGGARGASIVSVTHSSTVSVVLWGRGAGWGRWCLISVGAP